MGIGKSKIRSFTYLFDFLPEIEIYDLIKDFHLSEVIFEIDSKVYLPSYPIDFPQWALTSKEGNPLLYNQYGEIIVYIGRYSMISYKDYIMVEHWINDIDTSSSYSSVPTVLEKEQRSRDDYFKEINGFNSSKNISRSNSSKNV